MGYVFTDKEMLRGGEGAVGQPGERKTASVELRRYQSLRYLGWRSEGFHLGKRWEKILEAWTGAQLLIHSLTVRDRIEKIHQQIPAWEVYFWG